MTFAGFLDSGVNLRVMVVKGGVGAPHALSMGRFKHLKEVGSSGRIAVFHGGINNLFACAAGAGVVLRVLAMGLVHAVKGPSGLCRIAMKAGQRRAGCPVGFFPPVIAESKKPDADAGCDNDALDDIIEDAQTNRKDACHKDGHRYREHDRGRRHADNGQEQVFLEEAAFANFVHRRTPRPTFRPPARSCLESQRRAGRSAEHLAAFADFQGGLAVGRLPWIPETHGIIREGRQIRAINFP